MDVPIESLSLEQLMDLTVTSASKKEESLSGAPAAIYVITNEDLDRIEVIRGPGGALRGANTVNGVINVVSKSASQTQGLSIASTLGHDEGYQGSARFRRGIATWNTVDLLLRLRPT